MQKIYLCIFTLLLFSCQEQPNKNVYIPPASIDSFQNKFNLNLGADELKKIIKKIDFLIIDESLDSEIKFQKIDKVSPNKISNFIDCGTMNNEVYVDYINRIFDSSLKIKTTIEIKSIDKSNSRLKLISYYVFTSIETGTQWKFKTNESKMILVGTPAYGAEPYRECASKHLFESRIIKEFINQ